MKLRYDVTKLLISSNPYVTKFFSLLMMGLVETQQYSCMGTYLVP